jgi:hypothetical protein
MPCSYTQWREGIEKMESREQLVQLKKHISLSIIGQEKIVERLIICLLANGNLLMEGLPQKRCAGDIQLPDGLGASSRARSRCCYT